MSREIIDNGNGFSIVYLDRAYGKGRTEVFKVDGSTGAITINAPLTVNGQAAIGTTGTSLTLSGTLAVTGAQTFTGATALNGNVTIGSNKTLTTGTGAVSLLGATTLGANIDLLCATGSSKLDFSLGTGIFKTPTGAGTLSGTTNIAANKNLTCSSGTTSVDMHLGSGAFLTSTGLNTIGGDLLMASGKVVGFGAPQALTTSAGTGVANVTTECTLITSTGVADAVSLANGTQAGQKKTLMHYVRGGGTGTVVITPATPGGFSTLTLTALYANATVVWTGSAWAPHSSGGGVFA